MFKQGVDKESTKHSNLGPANIACKLTARDIALGIGRKATKEELEEYLSRPYGKSISLVKAIAQIKKKLKN